MKGLLDHTPEHVGPRWKGDRVQQQRNNFLANVGMFRIAQLPQTTNQELVPFRAQSVPYFLISRFS
jgi:hypothetical protein